MNLRLYWFSGTGNSLVVARTLAAALPDTELSPLAAVNAAAESCPECVGFIAPVYAFGLPVIVADFLRSVPLDSTRYIFTITTQSSMPGNVHHQARAILHDRGYTLNAGWSIDMPGNYTPLSGAPSEKKQQRRFAAAEKRITAIARAVQERRTCSLEDSFFLLRPLAKLIHAIGSPRMHGEDRKFFVQDTCTHCGICEMVCPVRNITLEEGKPVWQHHCQQCFACLQWCPVEAIQCTRITKGRKRYHHPDVTLEDIRMQHPLHPRKQ